MSKEYIFDDIDNFSLDMEPVTKRGPSSPKIIVDSNLPKDSSAIRPTPLKPIADVGAKVYHMESSGNGGNKIVVKQSSSDEMLVPERDTNNDPINGNGSSNDANNDVTANNVTNVVVGSDSPADSGYQILSR